MSFFEDCSFFDLGIRLLIWLFLDEGNTADWFLRVSAAISTGLEVSKGISMAMSDAVGEAAVGSGGERKRKRGSEPLPAKWRTEGEQRIYSSKLIDALRRVRRCSASAPSAAPSDHVRSREVREAADRVLAVSARGRTRWSRAILSGRTLRRRVRPRACRPKPASAGCVDRTAAERRKSPAVEKKTRVLGRLVPGCRKLPLPSLLEEVSDYITALEMQVRAMSAIADAFSTAGGAPSSPTHVNSM